MNYSKESLSTNEAIAKLMDIAVSYNGLFQLRYYGKGLSSISFKIEELGIRVKFSGMNLEWNLNATIFKLNEYLKDENIE